jgi:hypothetical protein
MPRPTPHRAYALRRLDRAVSRLIVATTPTEKARRAGGRGDGRERRARLWMRFRRDAIGDTAQYLARPRSIFAID